MTMGTASTMTAAAEALGLTLPGASSIPAVDSSHGRMAAACGGRIVELVWEDRRPGTILSAASFDNAVTAVPALGGSTNAVIHLIAIARRAGVDLALDRFDELSRKTPVLADIRPGADQPGRQRRQVAAGSERDPGRVARGRARGGPRPRRGAVAPSRRERAGAAASADGQHDQRRPAWAGHAGLPGPVDRLDLRRRLQRGDRGLRGRPRWRSCSPRRGCRR